MRKRSTTKKEKDRKAILIFAALLIVLAAVVTIQYMLGQSDGIDEVTLCPLGGAEKRTVVLVDKSDKWDDDDVNRIRLLLLDIYDGISAQNRLTIYSIAGEGRESTKVDMLFDKCNPGSEQECNALYQNCRRIRKRYEESFGERLTEIAGILEKPGEASFSPLYETLVQVIDDNSSPELDIHLVSDLMENGAKFRFYDVIPLAEEVVKEYPISRTANIHVYAHIEERRRHSRGLLDAVESVWRQYLTQQGVEVEFQRVLIAD